MNTKKSRLLPIAKKRKSIRNYKPEAQIPLEEVLAAIQVALEAPSGRNCQPWQFIIITDREIKREVRRICEEYERIFHSKLKGEFKEWLEKRGITWRKQFLEDATYLIVVYSNKECPYPIQSTWLAIGYLLLALEDMGLASLTYTPPKTDKINELLNTPNNYRLETIIPVGYPSKEKVKEPREKLENKVYINKWGLEI